jgi:N-acetylglucosaminyl-diphospho-decaprenol L-rhamnosyltransferase
MPEVTIAIVAYQSGAFLQACVDALAAQSMTDFEVVVADNASTDGSVEALRLPDGRFRIEPMGANLGFAAANNRVAFASTSLWFAALNPDAQAAPNWLAALLAAASRWPDAASFGSTQLSLDDPTRLDGAGDVWHAAGVAWRARLGWPAADIPPEGEVFGPCAAAALYRRDLFVGLGGFDERYFCYCEDVDLAYRLRLAGWAAVQVPDAVVRHAGSGISGRVSEFTLFHGHRNLIWTFVKNTPGAWLWFLAPWRIGYGLALIWAARRVGGARTVARAQWAALKGLAPILVSRRTVQAARRVRLGDLARAMAWAPLAPKRRDIVKIEPKARR